MSKDKYDRQTRLWGEGQILISSSKILSVSSDASVTEILKNLILSGIEQVTILDNTLITKDDLLNNFFISEEDIGKPRCEILIKNLLELNEDVRGNSMNQNIEQLINENKIDFIQNYDIILGSNLDDNLYAKLYKIAQTFNKRLINICNNGLYYMIRLYENYHANMNLRLHEKEVRDYRLASPFKELEDLAETMDTSDAYHIPYFIILLKALKLYKEKTGNDNPQTDEDMNIYKDIIRENFLKVNEQGDINENCQEAFNHTSYVSTYHKDCKNLLQTGQIPEIFEFVKENSAATLLKGSNDIMKIFFLYITALGNFKEKFNTMPLCGNIPDMISSTKSFIELKKVYNSKSKSDHDKIRQLMSEILNNLPENVLSNEEKQTLHNKINNVAPDDIDIVDVLNKNWPHITLFTYPKFEEEETAKNFEGDSCEETDYCLYILFKASEKFKEKFQRYPGRAVDDFTKDIEELASMAKNIIDNYEKKPYDLTSDKLDKDLVYEFCRMGRSYFPPAVSIVGSMASQEIIKMITYQFKTVNNTIIYNGVQSSLGCLTI